MNHGAGLNVDDIGLRTAAAERRLNIAPEKEPETLDIQQRDEIDIRDIWKRLANRKLIIFIVTVLVLVLMVFKAMRTPPSYEATVTMEIIANQERILDYDVKADEKQTISQKDFYQTQYELLKSRSLARRVIDDLNLEQKLSGGRKRPPPSGLDKLTQALKERFVGGARQRAAELEQKLGLYPIEQKLLADISVRPVKNSSIVTLSYVSNDPVEAATIANSFAKHFIELNIERRSSATLNAKKFLEEQLALAKARLEESEADLVMYAKEQAIYTTDDNKSLVTRKLEKLNDSLTEAEAERILAENAYKRVSESAGVDRVQKSNIIQKLKQSRLELMASYQDKLGIYKPDYPEMITLRQQIEDIEDELATEIEREKSANHDVLFANYKAAQLNEEAIRAELDKYKIELLANRDKSIGYKTLLRETETNRELYNGLLQRYKEVNIAGRVEANIVSVVDPALVPYKPVAPNIRNAYMMGLGGGLVFGIIVAFLWDFLDSRIRNPEEMDSLLGIPLVGSVPRSPKRLNAKEYTTIVRDMPYCEVAEAYRSMHANLLFSYKESTLKTICITSTEPEEGKTAAAVNLAATLGQAEKSVLLIDCDLLNPSIHERLALPNEWGLTQFLSGKVKARDIIRNSGMKNVKIITSGLWMPDTAGLINRERISKLLYMFVHSGHFDHIILNTPPVMDLRDSLVLANCANATVIVTAIGRTDKSILNQTYHRLRKAKANVIGVLLFTRHRKSGKAYSKRRSIGAKLSRLGNKRLVLIKG